MFAPTLAAFRETLLCPEGRFRTLGTPRCECDVRGAPLLRAGGCAVVVRAESGGRSYALKGYLRPRPQRADLYAALDRYPSSLRYPVRYLPGEIYLYVTDRGAWYDLLAADWAEGHTLDYAIRRALHRAENRRDERLVALLHALRAPEPALPALADLLRAPSKNR